MIPDKLLEAYYVFCIIVVTLIVIMAFGYFVAGFVQGIIKAVRRERQARQSRKYLNEVIGRLEVIEYSDEEGLVATGTLTPKGHELVQSGALTGFSIGYSIERE